MIALIIKECLFNRLHQFLDCSVFKKLSRIDAKRSFLRKLAFSMKATRSLVGLGMRMGAVVSIIIYYLCEA